MASKALISRSGFVQIDSGKTDGDGMTIFKNKTLIGKVVPEVDADQYVTVIEAITDCLKPATNGLVASKAVYECEN